MKTTTWAAFGSLFINLVLGLVIAAVFSAAPTAQAGEPATHVRCGGDAKHAKQAPPQAAPAPSRRAYLVEVRMGWGPAG